MSAVRQPFDLGATFVVAKESLVCDKRYMRGETVPLRRLGFSDLSILQLWNGHDIDCVAATAPVVVPVQPQPQPSKHQQRRR